MSALLAASTVAAAPKHDAPQPPVDPAPPKAPKAPPGPEDAHPTALLDKLAAATDPAARKAAIDELDALAPKAVDAIGAYLVRPHAFAVADRRKVLVAIKASIPDKSGKFSTPARQSSKDEKADDDFDWMAELDKADPSLVGLGEVIADDAAIRALALTKDVHAAALIYDAVFEDDEMIYRDEAGRYLRKMEPYSLPALTIEAESGNDYDRRRYATYELERMDRQEPAKALDAAIGDESLTVAVLDAFRATHHREAVHAVWTKVDADSPRVRAAARAAWLAYVQGPPPPPAPRRKLQMAGGKMSKYPMPLWLTYRELADNELRKAANELLHEDYPLADPSSDDGGGKTVAVDVEALTKRLFDFYDGERAKRDAAQWSAAKAKADAGDVAGAVALLDRTMATSADGLGGAPENRPAMAAIYASYGKQLEDKSQWQDASAAYAKAAGLDPTGAKSKHVLAAHHYTLGKALEAQAKDGGGEFRQAIALEPSYAPAQQAESDSEPKSPRPLWMLYAAGLAGAIALLMFGVAMMRRRA
nr:hypothetical protein [Kofleriaceae bacterium]